jgi:hypothetical protein
MLVLIVQFNECLNLFEAKFIIGRWHACVLCSHHCYKSEKKNIYILTASFEPILC